MNKESFQHLQLLEQSLHSVMVQKQQFQSQLIEVESALAELQKTDTAYKIIGNIMVSAKKADLKKDLEEKKELFSTRMKTLEKQEQKIKDDAAVIQKQLTKERKE